MRKIGEKCGVIAVTNKNDFDVARLAYLGLWSLQHRGQDSSGIASFDGENLHIHRRPGLVSQVYDNQSLSELQGRVAIGHNRYSTSGGYDDALNQPFVDSALKFAFAHNGNLPFTDKLTTYAKANHLPADGLNDTGLMSVCLAHQLKRQGSIAAALKNCWPLFTGAFSCVGLYEDQAFAFRDSHGIRPLALGRTSHGYVVTSETVALDIIGADYLRDVKPGELLIMQDDKLESVQIAEGREKIDAFEFVYLARPDSSIAGQSIYSARYRAGVALASVDPIKADTVIAVPDSGVPAAAGYSQGSGIKYEPGLIKNRYIGRTFIEPEKIRRNSVELKFNPIVQIVARKDVVLIDDSLVRGNTLKYVIKLLKSYGARSVHVRVASPPVLHPDFYGVDTPNNNDLMAHLHTTSEIRQIVGADSLSYLPLDQFIKSTGLAESRLCLSCFNGDYPIEVPYSSAKSKRANSAGAW